MDLSLIPLYSNLEETYFIIQQIENNTFIENIILKNIKSGHEISEFTFPKEITFINKLTLSVLSQNLINEFLLAFAEKINSLDLSINELTIIMKEPDLEIFRNLKKIFVNSSINKVIFILKSYSEHFDEKLKLMFIRNLKEVFLVSKLTNNIDIDVIYQS